MTYSEAQEIYQVYLEGHRMDPDNEELWEDLQRARKVRDDAWEAQHYGLDDISVLGALMG